MKEEKFKVIQYTREFIIRADKELENFPRRDFEIKTKIRENCYEILEILYEANLIQNVDKKKELLYKSIAKVKVIDYLLNLSYDKQIISNKKYIKLGAKLDDIIKYISGWLKSISDNNKLE